MATLYEFQNLPMFQDVYKRQVLMLSDSYKSEEDIERELDFIYSAPLEILEDEYKRKIHLFHKLGFVLSDSVSIS